MKTLRLAQLVLAAAMGLGSHCYGLTNGADLGAKKNEQAHKDSVAQIASLQKNAEAATQGALSEKTVDEQPWYEAREQTVTNTLSQR